MISRSATLRIAGTTAILAGLLWILPAAGLIEAFAKVPPTLWAVTVVGFLACHGVGALKWQLLVRSSGLSVDPRAAVRAYAVGLLANLWLPSVVGGDLVRAGVLARGHGGAGALAIGGVADRLLDALALGTLASTGSLIAPPMLASTTQRILASIAVVSSVGIGVVLGSRWLRAASRPKPKPVEHALAALDSLLAQPFAAMAAFAASLAIQLGFVGLNAALGRAMGIDVDFGVWLLVWPLAKLAAIVPISIGGLGVREVALAALLAPFAVPSVEAVAQSLVWQTVIIAGGAIAWLATTPLAAKPAAETA